MQTPDQLFGNLFDNEDITTDRLAAFTDDSLAKFASEDVHNQFDLKEVQEANDFVQAGLEHTDQSLNQQKGGTSTVDSVLKNFKILMREQEGVIANAVGGFDSAAYLEFYPAGLTEYSKLTKTAAPMVFARIDALADKYGTALGAALQEKLKAPKVAWQATRGTQLNLKGNVSGHRSDRDTGRTRLELALTTLVREVGAAFPGNVAQCKKFFAFHLLHAARHSSLEDKQDNPEA